jgi:predicted kinase
MLIAFAGLPASGKTTIARELARQLGAVHVRIDSIEQAMRAANVVPGSLDDAGYRVGYALAADNLRIGHTVIGDSVNPWMLTRNAWRDVAVSAGVALLEIEVVCSNPNEHRQRVETRTTDVPGLVLPDWAAVTGRDYRAWDRERTVIDTAGRTLSACVADALSAVRATAG